MATTRARTVGAHLPNEIVEVLQKRAEAISMTESRFIRLILEKWIAEGAPAVCPIDEMALKVAPKTTKKTA